MNEFCQGHQWAVMHLIYARVLHALGEARAVNAVAVELDKACCLVLREGFDDLLGGPRSGGMIRDVEVDDAAPFML